MRVFFKLNFFLFIWNWKWPLPQERASFSKLKSLCICIFSIISKKVIANLEVPPLTFQGVIFRKVLGIELFYFTQLVFRGKQPYILNNVEIPVGVVPNLVHLTENSPTARSTNLRVTHYNYSPQRREHEWEKGGGEGVIFFMEWRNGILGVCM